MSPIKSLLLAFASVFVIVVSSLDVRAATETFVFDKFGNADSLPIPDADSSGVLDQRQVDSSVSRIDSISVKLNLQSQWNGDLYAYLLHDDDFAVLLNRPGRTANQPYGYSDAGFNATLTSDSTAPDVHFYELTYTPPSGSPVTGVYQADGRDVDPNEVLDTDAKTAGLQVFYGLPASGEWVLFLADSNSGAQSELLGWELTVTQVPEPQTWALLLIAGLLWRFCPRLRSRGMRR